MSKKKPKADPAAQDPRKVTSLDEHWERFVQCGVQEGASEEETRKFKEPFYNGALVGATVLTKMRLGDERYDEPFRLLDEEIRRYTDTFQSGARAAGREDFWEEYVRRKVAEGEPEAEVLTRKYAYYCGAMMLFMIMQNANKNNYDSLLQSMLDACSRYFNVNKFEQSGAPTHNQIQ